MMVPPLPADLPGPTDRNLDRLRARRLGGNDENVLSVWSSDPEICDTQKTTCRESRTNFASLLTYHLPRYIHTWSSSQHPAPDLFIRFTPTLPCCPILGLISAVPVSLHACRVIFSLSCFFGPRTRSHNASFGNYTFDSLQREFRERWSLRVVPWHCKVLKSTLPHTAIIASLRGHLLRARQYPSTALLRTVLITRRRSHLNVAYTHPSSMHACMESKCDLYSAVNIYKSLLACPVRPLFSRTSSVLPNGRW